MNFNMITFWVVFFRTGVLLRNAGKASTQKKYPDREFHQFRCHRFLRKVKPSELLDPPIEGFESV